MAVDLNCKRDNKRFPKTFNIMLVRESNVTHFDALKKVLNIGFYNGLVPYSLVYDMKSGNLIKKTNLLSQVT